MSMHSMTTLHCSEALDLLAQGALHIDGERMYADFAALNEIGVTETGVNRLALSPEDVQARAWFAERIEEAGLWVRDDDAGNLSGVLPTHAPQARTLLIGSHLDSVPDGGRYDGALGMIAALEVARTLRESGVALPVHLETIDFTDDEGCWRSLFGARALVGLLTQDDIGDMQVDNGAFRAALTRAGIDPRAVFRARRDPGTLAGYLELHIEQSSRLERARVPIGIVTNIVGRTTYEITFQGQAGHSGTTDMYRRRDALRGAAQFITRAHEVTRQKYGDGIFNCGDVEVKPGAFNIIPSLARLVVEVRHVNAALLHEMELEIIGLAREAAAANGLDVEMEHIVTMPAAPMSALCTDAIVNACARLDVASIPLVSFSGHAAQVISTVTPSGMLFVPSVGGVSHHPDEFTEWDDAVRGANVLLGAVLSFCLAYAPPGALA